MINSTLQPTLGLRWLLCYEENDREICHLQKAAPKHWFSKGQRIAVAKCPTRFGHISWTCTASDDSSWQVVLEIQTDFGGEIHLHIHPPSGNTLRSSSVGNVSGQVVVIPATALTGAAPIRLSVTT